MKRISLVEDQLRAAATRWKWLQFWILTARFGIGACVVFLFLGALMVSEIISNKHIVIVTSILSSVFIAVGWLVIALNLIASDSERAWLARELENENPDLYDRVNTIVHLEKATDSESKAFFDPIAGQAQTVLLTRQIEAPFSSANAWLHAVTLVLVCGLTAWFFGAYDPWGKVMAASELPGAVEEVAEEELPLELAFPTNTVAEMEKPWAEIRITDPGYDITINRTSSVPVQIEAAANSPLSDLQWRSALNAGVEEVHQLPSPDEPLFAAYSRVIDAQEMRLADWDVLTYFAGAKTDNGKHESEIYFLEVQPLPEELDALRGGSSQCYDFLNELTGLIREQQHLIRLTRTQANQKAPDPVEWDNLADSEEEMTVSIEHFTAGLRAAFDEKLLAGILGDLKQARIATDSAAILLRDHAGSDGELLERSALAHLSAARQHFQQAISRNPDAFRDPADPKLPNPDLAKRLAEMEEFNNEAKAAAEFVKATRKKQDEISQRLAKTTSSAVRKRMADEEKQLREKLKDFQDKHPQAFAECQSQGAAAGQAMSNAEGALRSGSSSNARNRSAQAGESLEKLENAVRAAADGQQLVDAHQLKEMLDDQIQQMGQATKPGAGGMSREQVQQLTDETKKTLKQMQQAASNGGGTNAFGDELREALAPEKLSEMNQQLDQTAGAPQDAQRRDAAGKARNGMQEVSNAFDQSLPSPLQLARSKDQLGRGKPGQSQQGMDQLSEMLQQMKDQNRQLSESERKQMRSALDQMRYGRAQKGAGSDRSQMIALLLEEIDKGEPMDALKLRQLVEQLKRFNAELPDGARPDPEKLAGLKNIDPGKFPPAYRSRIENYFRKLSEGR